MWIPVEPEDGSDTYYNHLAGFIHQTLQVTPACKFFMQELAGSLLFGKDSEDPEKRLNAWKIFKETMIFNAQQLDDRTEWFNEDFIEVERSTYDGSVPVL